jgi:hypothetical protein
MPMNCRMSRFETGFLWCSDVVFIPTIYSIHRPKSITNKNYLMAFKTTFSL